MLRRAVSAGVETAVVFLAILYLALALKIIFRGWNRIREMAALFVLGTLPFFIGAQPESADRILGVLCLTASVTIAMGMAFWRPTPERARQMNTEALAWPAGLRRWKRLRAALFIEAVAIAALLLTGIGRRGVVAYTLALGVEVLTFIPFLVTTGRLIRGPQAAALRLFSRRSGQEG